jgi:hypothetical protein
MHEAGTFARHGIFVATGYVEGAIRDGSEVGRACEKAVISIDDDEAVRRRKACD